MKIMHLISSAASGGAEMYVKDLATAMSKIGHDVFIVFLDRASESGRDSVFEKEFLADLDQLGIGYGFLGRVCRKNIIKGFLRLARFRRQFRPDVIHTHLYYGAIFAISQFGVPHVYTHHNIKLKAPVKLYRLLDLRTSAYIGICYACEKMLAKVTCKPVKRIDNGVAMSRVTIKKEYTSGSPIKIVTVGSLGEQKNQGLLLNALARLSDYDFSLTVAGEGNKKEELQNLSESLGIGYKVDFIGNCNNVKKLLHDSDLFVMSSLWEGLPIAQIEATLTGLPVLVTDVGGCPEIVDQVQNGLVAQAEIGDFTKKLDQLISDNALRFKFHENALANSGRYTIESAVESHMQLYENVTNKSITHA